MNIRATITSVVLTLALSMSGSAQDWTLLLPYRIYNVITNPLNPNTVYATNYSHRLFRTRDGCATWDTLYSGEFGTVNNYLTSIATCPADTNILLVGGFAYDGIKRTTDGGETWERVLNDQNGPRFWTISDAIAFDPNDPDIVYAARGQTYNAVYRSMDRGATWDSIGAFDRSITKRICTIAIREDSSNILVLGCEGGIVMLSQDSGRTWGKMRSNGDKDSIFPDSEIPKIVFSRIDPRVGYYIVAISDANAIKDNGGLFKTTDGGYNWERIAFGDTSFWAVETRNNRGVDDIMVGGFRTFTLPSVIKGDSVVQRSLDGGITWENINDVPWTENEVGRTTANVWIIRYDERIHRWYLATEAGLFIRQETVNSVDEERTSMQLRVTSYADHLLMSSDRSLQGARWIIADLQGRTLASGMLETAEPARVALPAHASGLYVVSVQTQDGSVAAQPLMLH
jgi:photosystem II stability/assembly factor-like uncharacterized protein